MSLMLQELRKTWEELSVPRKIGVSVGAVLAVGGGVAVGTHGLLAIDAIAEGKEVADAVREHVRPIFVGGAAMGIGKALAVLMLTFR